MLCIFVLCITQNAWNTKYQDPSHPTCTTNAPRIALALYGGISGKTSKFNPFNQADFVNVSQTANDLWTHVISPSGGADTFIHSRVKSSAMQSLLLKLYRPVDYEFEGNYHSVSSRYKELSKRTRIPEKEVSRWASIASVLSMIRNHQSKSGITYSHIYLTRPDIGIWKDIDVRKYCTEVFYFNNCFPPYWQYQCQADFHFVFGQILLREFSMILSHFETGLAHFTGRQGHLTNDEIIKFIKKMKCKWAADHVVVQRHEEVLRKGASSFRRKYRSLFLE